MRLSERFAIIPVIEPEDHNSAGVTGESIDMSKLEHLTLIFTFGELTANSDLIIYEGATDA